MGYGDINPLHPKGGGQGRNFRRGPYNHRKWRRLRRRKLAESPLCEVCLAEGRVHPAEVIHHVVDHGGSVTKFFLVSLDGLQSLCREHHEKLHGRKVEPVQIGVDGWPVERHHGVDHLRSGERNEWEEEDDDGNGRNSH
jgi:hypothetical protein